MAQTHCEKYGHTWVLSSSDLVEKCSQFHCNAVRRVSDGFVYAAPARSRAKQKQGKPVQQGLWEMVESEHAPASSSVSQPFLNPFTGEFE